MQTNKISISDAFRLKKDHCLNCKKELDAATGVNNKSKPKKGDITICIACGHVMCFSLDLKLAELSDEEIIEIAGNKNMLLIQEARKHAGVHKKFEEK